MENSIKYIVQDNHIVCFDSNEIFTITPMYDQQEVNKVEPRIMEVLQILIAHQPRLVTREYLIKNVWNDYPSADDALNQAISQLRKVLADNDKENRIIETVVKKGYRFKGVIKPITEEKSEGKKFIVSKKLIYIMVGFLIIIILFVTLYFQFFSEETNAPLAPGTALYIKL